MKHKPYPYTTGKDMMQKDVVNKYDGGKLGYVKNFEIDLCNGCIRSLILPPLCGGFFSKKEEEITIPWENIETIGKDVILVRYLPASKDACSKGGDCH